MKDTKTSRAEDVRAFHEACSLPVGDPANPGLTHDEALLRARLIAEEVLETMHALGLSRAQVVSGLVDAIGKAGPWPAEQQDADIVALADGTADACYVLLGTDVQAGIPSDKVWAEVQRSNMAKAGGTCDEHGKLQKPPGWTPPDVAGVLAKAQREAQHTECTGTICMAVNCAQLACECPVWRAGATSAR